MAGCFVADPQVPDSSPPIGKGCEGPLSMSSMAEPDQPDPQTRIARVCDAAMRPFPVCTGLKCPLRLAAYSSAFPCRLTGAFFMLYRYLPPSLVAMASAFLIQAAIPGWAAEADLPPPVSLSAEQLRAAGIEFQRPQPAATGSMAHLPAQVGVPNAQQRVISAPVEGLLVELRVAPGDKVKAGQVLARIASPQLLSLQRELAQARIDGDLAGRNLARDEALFREGIIAESRLQASRAAQGQAQAAVSEKAGVLALAGGKVEAGGALVLTAPMDGVILEQLARPGARLEAAAPILHLARLEPLSLEIQVPAGEALRLAPGQAVTVRALLERGLGGLSPGQLVEAEIDAAPGRGGDTWRLPAGALVRLGSGGRTMVFVERAAGLTPVPVRWAGESGGEVLVG